MLTLQSHLNEILNHKISKIIHEIEPKLAAILERIDWSQDYWQPMTLMTVTKEPPLMTVTIMDHSSSLGCTWQSASTSCTQVESSSKYTVMILSSDLVACGSHLLMAMVSSPRLSIPSGTRGTLWSSIKPIGLLHKNLGWGYFADYTNCSDGKGSKPNPLHF